MKSTTPTRIEIRPEVTMLSVLRHINYKAWYAIAEFIDNALQSYLANSASLNEIHGNDFQLCVSVEIDPTPPGLITITDNAAGIRAEDFQRAFRAAQVPDDRSGLSEFGMGMKSAACWFAEKWSVRTKAVHETTERTISFDISQIVGRRLETLDVAERAIADPAKHYTVVTLRNLHHTPQGRTTGKIKDHLASIYRQFLRDGTLALYVNGESLKYDTPAVLKSVRYVSPGVPDTEDSAPIMWRKDIDLDFGSGQRVRGFAALREVGSTNLAGFALFRRGRLIEGSHDETYRPSFIFKQTNSYPYQRIFGELHVEGFEVSHTKDGFRWEEYEDLFLDFLKEALEQAPIDLLAQANNYRALPIRRTIEARATSATDAVADYIESEVAPLLRTARSSPHDVVEIPESIHPSSLQTSERTVVVSDGTWRWVITLRTSVDPSRDPWVTMAKLDTKPGDSEETRRLEVEIALAHPFSAEFLGANNENIELFLRFGSAYCISLILAEDFTGQTPAAALQQLNYLLRGALIQPAR